MYCAWNMCQVLCIYYLMPSASFPGGKWDLKKINDVPMAPATQVELGLTSGLCDRKAFFLYVLGGNSTDDLAVCLSRSSQLCGEPDLMLSSPHLSSVPLPKYVAGPASFPVRSWVAWPHPCSGAAHVPAKVSQEVTKKQLPGVVAHERAPLWPSPVKLSCWFPEGSLQGTWWSKPTCYSQPPAGSSPMHPLSCWEQTWNWSENRPEWAYTHTF